MANCHCSARDLFTSARKFYFSSKIGNEEFFYTQNCFPYFPCIFRRLGNLVLFLIKITNFLVQKLIKPKKKSFKLQKLLYFKKKYNLVSTRKLKWTSSDWLVSETFQLGLAQLGKFQLELITNNCPQVNLLK